MPFPDGEIGHGRPAGPAPPAASGVLAIGTARLGVRRMLRSRVIPLRREYACYRYGMIGVRGGSPRRRTAAACRRARTPRACIDV